MGSNIKDVVGAKHQLSQKQGKFKSSEASGCTRLELSLYMGNESATNNTKLLVNRDFVPQMNAIIDEISSNVLNGEGLRERIFKTMSIPRLISSFSQIKKNILILGSFNSWIINCVTSHSGHSVGSECSLGLKARGTGDAFFSRLRQFINRFANPNSSIQVFVLVRGKVPQDPICAVRKRTAKFFQLPCCTLPMLNGITTPFAVVQPISM